MKCVQNCTIFDGVILHSVELNYHSMPKSVDIYVLEKKVGSGQFGDVFKGYSKVDGTEVAVKTIKRDKIKGKFSELLESEIQVLKCCRNNNIVRLIDIKKTVNNIYLILQFCNEGDLFAYLKQKKKLPQEEALEYFVQILHAFQTLVKSKIMHRDFKLANVLKHDGCIKIADFGFAKLLGSEDEQAETILGSPLNMAPEVLDHQSYNSKADIWSIGVAFYELIFGKVPFTASNIVDLVKKIHKEAVVFPHKVHPHVEDVIRRMLVVDPNKRIEWNELFKHPVTRLLQDNIEQDLKLSFLCKKEEIPFNMSKFYIKTNKVIENVHEISAKKQLNNYVKEAIYNKQKAPYQGAIIRRHSERQNKQNCSDLRDLPTKTEKQLNQEQPDPQAEKKALQVARLDRIRRNCKQLLHKRNIYAFLGHIAEDLIETHHNDYYQCLAFLLVKKVMGKISFLKQSVKKREIKNIEFWSEFESSSEYKEITQFISGEEEIFNKFYEKLSLKVFEQGTLSKFEEDFMISGKYTLEETNNRIFERVLRQYVCRIMKDHKVLTFNIAIQLLKLLDSLRAQVKFSQEDFDFLGYYQQFSDTEENLVRENAKYKIESYLKNSML